MQHGHPLTEIRGKPPHHLRRQHNFRHQHDGLLPQLQYFPNQAKIDLGFSAAGNALKQHRAGLSAAEHGHHGIQGRLLLVVEDHRSGGRLFLPGLRDPKRLLFGKGQKSLFFHGAQRCR